MTRCCHPVRRVRMKAAEGVAISSQSAATIKKKGKEVKFATESNSEGDEPDDNEADDVDEDDESSGNEGDEGASRGSQKYKKKIQAYRVSGFPALDNEY